MFPILFPLGTTYWQSQPTPQNAFDSILNLMVEIGPQGGSLSFDWSMYLAEFGGSSDIFLVKLDDVFLLFEQGDIIDGHVDVNLLPGTHFIQFAVSPRAGGPAGGAGIDNVRVTGLVPGPEVPEPASGMLLAMGGLGLLYRRRSRRA